MMIFVTTAQKHLFDKDLLLLCPDLIIAHLKLQETHNWNISALLLHSEVLIEWRSAQHIQLLAVQRVKWKLAPWRQNSAALFTLELSISCKSNYLDTSLKLKRAFIQQNLFFMAKIDSFGERLMEKSTLFQHLSWDKFTLHKGRCTNLGCPISLQHGFFRWLAEKLTR